MRSKSSWFIRGITGWFDQFRARHGLSTEPLLTDDAPAHRVLLHVGCGRTTVADIAPAGFRSEAWREVRLDANPDVFPDIVDSMVAMDKVPASFADAIFSAHNIEHLYPHEVQKAFTEFHRVLRADGFLVVTCPDLQSVCALVAEGKLHDTAYDSSAGPIAAIDMLYGHRPSMAQGNMFMAHRTGFTLNSLIQQLRMEGFRDFYGFRRPEAFDLWLIASKAKQSEEAMRTLAANYLVSMA